MELIYAGQNAGEAAALSASVNALASVILVILFAVTCLSFAGVGYLSRRHPHDAQVEQLAGLANAVHNTIMAVAGLSGIVMLSLWYVASTYAVNIGEANTLLNAESGVALLNVLISHVVAVMTPWISKLAGGALAEVVRKRAVNTTL